MYDILIHNVTVVTVDADFTILSNGAVALGGGRIQKVWRPGPDDPLPDAAETIDAGGGMVMPGLVNAHTHLPMSLFRGLADDLPLETWLDNHIFPAEAQHISPDTVAPGARLACAELLLGGTTTCCDGYFLVTHFAAAVVETGIRAILGQGVIDFPAPGVPDPALNVATAKAFAEQWRHWSTRLQPAIFCHSPYTCSARTLVAAKQAADELGVLLQVHAAESSVERDRLRREQGRSPIAYLSGLDLLDPNTLLVHAVWLDEEDLQTIAAAGAPVVHCPESNMKLASGVSPVPDLLAAGIAVGLGTDGSASNNDLDLWSEMDSAAKLHKVHRNDPTVMDAETVVRMATVEGARALGLDRQIGSLEPGKKADLIVLRPDRPHLTPLYHPASHLVYAARPDDVRHVLVDGRWVVRDGSLLTVDVEGLMAEVSELARRIKP
ncbi:MAG: amidohydrolase [Desulfatitalea sp.]|nr:amidohydrolase [Desulfatitalea sp.]NNK00175.1 amidohydrolase [Desulfatitalea sp.]